MSSLAQTMGLRGRTQHVDHPVVTAATSGQTSPTLPCDIK